MNSFLFRPNGTRFSAPPGTLEFAKKWNPQPGDIISFKHRGFLPVSLKPKLPTLYRIRTDLSWDDVVQKATSAQPRIPDNSNPLHSLKLTFSRTLAHPHSHNTALTLSHSRTYALTHSHSTHSRALTARTLSLTTLTPLLTLSLFVQLNL